MYLVNGNSPTRSFSRRFNVEHTWCVSRVAQLLLHKNTKNKIKIIEQAMEPFVKIVNYFWKDL